MPMTREDQVLLGKLLKAATVLLVRTNADIRGEVVNALARDHEGEVVGAIARKLAA